MRALRAGFEALDLRGSALKREADKKMEVMQTCVHKIEMAAYGVQIRGRERPKGWVPDLSGGGGGGGGGGEEDRREAVESY